MNEGGAIQLRTGASRAPRRGRLWSIAIAMMLLAQFALAFHGLNHRIHPEAASLGGDCALCQVASNMAPAPESVTLAPPALSVGEYIAVAEQIAPRRSWPTAGFRSRAPPLSV